MSLEGEFSVEPAILSRNVQGGDGSQAGGCWQRTDEKHAFGFTSI
jgi:hypothetical protein